ncbi:hypothetical protein THAOC_32958, partial [Thalassiosira oceanica]
IVNKVKAKARILLQSASANSEAKQRLGQALKKGKEQHEKCLADKVSLSNSLDQLKAAIESKTRELEKTKSEVESSGPDDDLCTRVKILTGVIGKAAERRRAQNASHANSRRVVMTTLRPSYRGVIRQKVPPLSPSEDLFDGNGRGVDKNLQREQELLLALNRVRAPANASDIDRTREENLDLSVPENGVHFLPVNPFNEGLRSYPSGLQSAALMKKRQLRMLENPLSVMNRVDESCTPVELTEGRILFIRLVIGNAVAGKYGAVWCGNTDFFPNLMASSNGLLVVASTAGTISPPTLGSTANPSSALARAPPARAPPTHPSPFASLAPAPQPPARPGGGLPPLPLGPPLCSPNEMVPSLAFLLFALRTRALRGGGGGSRGGGGLFGAKRTPAPPARKPAPPPPAPAASRPSAQPPAPQQSFPPAQQSSSGGGMLSGIGSTIAQGMAFGTGSAIAHRAVGAAANAMTGGGGGEAPADQAAEPQHVASQVDGACAYDKTMYFDCLKVGRVRASW